MTAQSTSLREHSSHNAASIEILGTPLDTAIGRAQRYLLSLQHPSGYWIGNLDSNAGCEADYLLLHVVLGNSPATELIAGLARYIRSAQTSSGGWSTYPGGAPDLDVTIRSYAALLRAGDDLKAEHMTAARACLKQLSRAQRLCLMTQHILAAAGLVEWCRVALLPPELLLVLNSRLGAFLRLPLWARLTLEPLSVLSAARWVTGHTSLHDAKLLSSIARHHSPLASIARLASIITPSSVRHRALQLVVRRVMDQAHVEILPAAIFQILCHLAVGHEPDRPAIRYRLKNLSAHTYRCGDQVRVQPCLSPVWDSAWSIIALRASGLSTTDQPLVRAADWLCGRQSPCGGWPFGLVGDLYPDGDDTSVVLCALGDMGLQQSLEFARGVRWLANAQDSSGGWAAFYSASAALAAWAQCANREELRDPTCADITAKALIVLTRAGSSRACKGVDFLVRSQEAVGAWRGRWGVNRIYGTWSAITALVPVLGQHDPAVARARQWFERHQNEDGGWGESCESYVDLGASHAASTASQTSWALMGLLASGCTSRHVAVRRGIEYLLSSQLPSGTWRETQHTGTGFPGTYYLKYELYPLYFPLMALGMYRATLLHGVRES